MTTSNQPSVPSPEKSEWVGTHWDEMIATLPAEQTDRLSQWIGDDLADLEMRMSKFASPRSKSIAAKSRR